MEKNMDKSLFFITLSMICVWLIVDMAVGKNYLGNFLTIIFPFMDNSGRDLIMTETEQEQAANNAPSSSAMGQSKDPGAGWGNDTTGRSSSAYTGGNGSSHGVRSK